MDAFESLIGTLLRRKGYWTAPSFKVELTREEKILINRHTVPRWEIDLVAYKAKTNKLLAVECKSFLDSTGVVYRNGTFEPVNTYKLFGDVVLRKTILNRLRRQLVKSGACLQRPKVRLCLAAGKIASKTDRRDMNRRFSKNRWQLFGPEWIREELKEAAASRYENDIAFVVAKILLRQPN